MKIETILNAMTLTAYSQSDTFRELMEELPGVVYELMRTDRQYRAFRARILRTFAIYKNFAEANGFDREQAWFWTDEWQAAEKEVDHHIRLGEVQSFDSMDEFLATLEEAQDD